MNPCFEIKKDKKGQFYFNLKAGNGQVILTSETYPQRRTAIAGIESVRKNGIQAAAFEEKSSKNGKQHFVLKAKNSEVIGRSQTYANKAGVKRGIASVQRNCPQCEVRDLTA